MLIDGVVKLVPVPNAVPPVDTEYQRTVAPVLAVAPKVTVPVPHLAPGEVPVIVGSAFTVTVTAVREAETQPVDELYAST